MQGSETIIGLTKVPLSLLARLFTPAITLFSPLLRAILLNFLDKVDTPRLQRIPVYCRIERSPNGQQNAHRFVPPRRNTGGRNPW
jgi:hypothetical protein